MSTTDTRAAFEVWWKQSHNVNQPLTIESVAWMVWQAATEAAKATGTAGDLSPVPRAFTGQFEYVVPGKSMTRIESGYTADQMREYGQACAAMARGAAVRDYIENGAEAARQPAPVAAQENGGLVRAALIDLMEIEQAATAGEFKQDMTFDFAKQSHYRALFARARAALAATAAPVLSDEQILQIAAAEAIDNVTDERRPDNSTIICFARAILAATNRSQP